MERWRKVLRNSWFVLRTLAIVAVCFSYVELILLIFDWQSANKFWRLVFSMAEKHPIVFLISIGVLIAICLAAFIEGGIISGREEDKKRYDRQNP